MPKACFPLFAPAHPELVQQLDEFYTNDDDLTFDLDPVYGANFLSSLNMKNHNQNSEISALSSILNFSGNSATSNLPASSTHVNQQHDFHGSLWASFGQNFANNDIGTQQEEEDSPSTKDNKKQNKKSTTNKKGHQGKGYQKKKYIKKAKKKVIEDSEESLPPTTSLHQQNL